MSYLTVLQAQEITSQHWNINGNATVLHSEWGGTFRIKTEHESYLLKVSPPDLGEGRIHLEIAAARHIQSRSATLKCPHIISTQDGNDFARMQNGIARLYTWIEGRLWSDVHPHSPALIAGLGQALGQFTNAFIGFDHPGAHDVFLWAPESSIWREALVYLPPDLQELCKACVLRYEQLIASRESTLRYGVIYHDANDYNILVSGDILNPSVIGFIDYGDCLYAPVIYDLAVCLAYILMDQSDLLGALRIVVTNYHQQFPIVQDELEILQDLICLRLVISLAHAARRKTVDADNTYWQVSASPAERLLRSLYAIHPHLMLSTLRAACGLEPSPNHERLYVWLKSDQSDFAPVMGFDLSKEAVTVFDWSVGSTELGSMDEMDDLDEQTHKVFSRMRKEGIGVGRYDEPRPIYSTHEYQVPGLHIPGMRTIHLGIDLVMPAGTPIYAPLDGKVVTLTNNEGHKEYGPLVILEHMTDDGLPFYTLYGHNNIYTLSQLSPGQEVRAGNKIGEIGDYPENGNWVPHLHFQIMTDLLGYVDDFPGVADPDARDIWLSLCPDPNLILGINHPDLRYHYSDQPALLRKRKKLLGSNLSLSYPQPLHIVRGWKTHLYDECGRTFLDLVNNIAHVGHEHPRIVRAGQTQMAILNTNTRYLHRQILTLSQQLLDTLPGHLQKIWFVNSGSEANELALRMARAFTGSKDTLVLEEGYHGNTQACIDVSHYKFKHLDDVESKDGGKGKRYVVPIALYRRPAREVTDLQAGGVDEVTNFVQSEIASFAKGIVKGPMVFIHESLPSCAGQIVPDEDFFMDVYAEIKKHGGVCIADEVQTGLGRVGSHYWAFELFTIAPDIVTIGKPLGNGHPVAAVVCTRDVANAFGKSPEFFSSFGGNPVSCAIASEVLSVVEEEALQSHALELGNYWIKALRELQSIHPVIGDVRGHGLFIGVEFVEPGSQTPARQKGEYVVQRLLDHRILTSLDGPHGNVIKIKPPMSIGLDDVNRFLEVMEKILKEDLITKFQTSQKG